MHYKLLAWAGSIPVAVKRCAAIQGLMHELPPAVVVEVVVVEAPMMSSHRPVATSVRHTRRSDTIHLDTSPWLQVGLQSTKGINQVLRI